MVWYIYIYTCIADRSIYKHETFGNPGPNLMWFTAIYRQLSSHWCMDTSTCDSFKGPVWGSQTVVICHGQITPVWGWSSPEISTIKLEIFGDAS